MPKVRVDSGADDPIVSPTLTIRLRIFLLSVCCLTAFAQDGFVALFNGRDLIGWDAEPGLWTVQDGVIVGTSEMGRPKTNSFLIWKGTVKNFELRATIRVVGDNNSGIQYRSRRLPEITPWTITGYQCDVHPVDVHTAMTYEERGRGIFGYNGVDVVMDPTGQRWQVRPAPSGSGRNLQHTGWEAGLMQVSACPLRLPAWSVAPSKEHNELASRGGHFLIRE